MRILVTFWNCLVEGYGFGCPCMKTWYYIDPSNQQAQVLDYELSHLVEDGQIVASTVVWSQGMGDWQPASQALPQLFSAHPAKDELAPPPIPHAAATTQCHEVDYEIFGDDMQIVEVELDPGETVIAEAGAMNYLEEDITFESKMGDGSQPNEGFRSHPETNH